MSEVGQESPSSPMPIQVGCRGKRKFEARRTGVEVTPDYIPAASVPAFLARSRHWRCLERSSNYRRSCAGRSWSRSAPMSPAMVAVSLSDCPRWPYRQTYSGKSRAGLTLCEQDPLRRRPRKSTARYERRESYVWTTRKLAEWASEHGPITKIGLSDGRGGKNIPTAVQFGYGRSGFGGYLGNVG